MASSFVRLAARSSATKFLPRFTAAPKRCFATTPLRKAEAEYQRTTLTEITPSEVYKQGDAPVAPSERKMRHYTVNFVRSSLRAWATMWRG
jgi:hypothetical protein